MASWRVFIGTIEHSDLAEASLASWTLLKLSFRLPPDPLFRQDLVALEAIPRL